MTLKELKERVLNGIANRPIEELSATLNGILDGNRRDDFSYNHKQLVMDAYAAGVFDTVKSLFPKGE